jgi:hypothetical protein
MRAASRSARNAWPLVRPSPTSARADEASAYRPRQYRHLANAIAVAAILDRSPRAARARGRGSEHRFSFVESSQVDPCFAAENSDVEQDRFAARANRVVARLIERRMGTRRPAGAGGGTTTRAGPRRPRSSTRRASPAHRRLAEAAAARDRAGPGRSSAARHRRAAGGSRSLPPPATGDVSRAPVGRLRQRSSLRTRRSIRPRAARDRGSR